jgi:hypothetical protein
MRGPYGGRRYDWAQCRYCGRAQNGDCRPVACLLCSTVQCHGNGSGNGCCSVCHYGYLPGWSRTPERETCGYQSCEDSAVARVPRVGRACPFHTHQATIRFGGRTITMLDWMIERVAERDAGRPEWARWTFLPDEAVAMLATR